MSKKKRTIRFKMASNKPAMFSANDALRIAGQQYMKSEKELTPLIVKRQIPPGEAVVLIACHMHASVAGELDDHRMSEEDIIGASTLMVTLWEQGYFAPSKQFPYTFEEVQAAMQDDEDRGEE